MSTMLMFRRGHPLKTPLPMYPPKRGLWVLAEPQSRWDWRRSWLLLSATVLLPCLNLPTLLLMPGDCVTTAPLCCCHLLPLGFHSNPSGISTVFILSFLFFTVPHALNLPSLKPTVKSIITFLPLLPIHLAKTQAQLNLTSYVYIHPQLNVYQQTLSRPSITTSYCPKSPISLATNSLKEMSTFAASYSSLILSSKFFRPSGSASITPLKLLSALSQVVC